MIKLQQVMYLCTMPGCLTQDSEYNVLPLFTSLFDENVNKKTIKSKLISNLYYSFKQINVSSLISSQEGGENHTHPVQQIKHNTQHRSHMYLIHTVKTSNSF